ncbi:MAG: lactate racemase domain-containing protein [Pirellulales bacterium]
MFVPTPVPHPQVFRVRQTFDRPLVRDIPGTVRDELTKLDLGRTIKPGQTVAITAGSRGINNIRVILRAIVDHVKSLNAIPIMIPAMGSHGGGTAEGQLGVLESYEITPETMGCEFRASMETVIVGQAKEGFAVHFDKHAYSCDHTIVCGRVKPHTEMTGNIQSGLMKMLLIGCGKHNGAKIYHRAIHDYEFPRIVRSVAGEVLAKCRIAAGLAIIENGYDETAYLRGVSPAEFEAKEIEHLKIAIANLPRLPFREVDMLLVDEIGKNISGTGMDTNVIGRKYSDHMAGPDEWPKCKRIVVRSLTEETHGNASGLGIAEFCKSQVIRDFDKKITWLNAWTSGHMSCVMDPLHWETDRELLDVCLPTIGLTEPEDAKFLWIKNTLHLSEVECGATYWNAAKERSDLEILTEPRPLPLDASGNLPVFEIGH